MSLQFLAGLRRSGNVRIWQICLFLDVILLFGAYSRLYLLISGGFCGLRLGRHFFFFFFTGVGCGRGGELHVVWDEFRGNLIFQAEIWWYWCGVLGSTVKVLRRFWTVRSVAVAGNVVNLHWIDDKIEIQGVNLVLGFVLDFLWFFWTAPFLDARSSSDVMRASWFSGGV